MTVKVTAKDIAALPPGTTLVEQVHETHHTHVLKELITSASGKTTWLCETTRAEGSTTKTRISCAIFASFMSRGAITILDPYTTGEAW